MTPIAYDGAVSDEATYDAAMAGEDISVATTAATELIVTETVMVSDMLVMSGMSMLSCAATRLATKARMMLRRGAIFDLEDCLITKNALLAVWTWVEKGNT